MLAESFDGDGSVSLVLDSPRGLRVEIGNSRRVDVGDGLEVEVSEEGEGSLRKREGEEVSVERDPARETISPGIPAELRERGSRRLRKSIR